MHHHPSRTLSLETLHKVIFSRTLFFLMVLMPVTAVVSIKMLDFYLVMRPPRAIQNNPVNLTLYPYDGMHLYGDVEYRGLINEPGTEYTEFEISIGDHGYFIDFDLDNPPPKQANEFRIILIGNSGSQGWGARTNEDMLYRILEKQLALTFPDLKIRIINMAMAASTTYQNFISLNLWGHQLEPDLILSISGATDFVMPALTDSNLPVHVDVAMGATTAIRGTQTFSDATPIDSPPVVGLLNNLIPGIMQYTNFGPAIRAYFHDFYANEALDAYATAMGIQNLHDTSPQPTVELVQGVILPQYVHALQSIKRDFEGIPLMIVFQPYYRDRADAEKTLYAAFIREAQNQIDGYMNEDWAFLNLQDYWNHYAIYETGVGDVHLNNEGQQLMADLLTPELTTIISHASAQ